MQHQQRSGARLSQNSDTEDTAHIVRLLAPRLAYFAGVARTEHVTRAARELGVPQSTLSRALVRLEQDLGVDLFARHGRTVSLTPAGRTFLASAERARTDLGWKPERADLTGIVRDAWEFTRARHEA